MELFAAIRWDEKQLGLSIRELATKYGVHRRTVRQALACPIPPERKDPLRSAPVRDSIAHLVDQILKADCLAPPKQRHTARRIWERLLDEHQVSVSYSYVAKYVHHRRGEINAEHAQRTGVAAGFVPQLHEPGKDAEVDFADCYVKLAGKVTKCFLFSFRLSCSGAGVHRVFASQRTVREGMPRNA
ncbi:hypothetical protein ACQP1K_28800 (plasmid) [Sphaerimonospora sp. CA-214678]|uniref:hypothetical protein n=1 Tax=Sphaerimonospora sp. CA-214678 TaxID=3240029 RepID=UPI003D912D30